MLSNLVRFILIAVVGIVSVMLILGIAGVLSSAEIWGSVTKVVEIAGVVLVGSMLVLFVTKNK